MADNTTLNSGSGGDVIATEDVQSTNQQDADQSLPAPEYKVPRSKIAVGSVDRDLGDATDDTPLATRDRTIQRTLEDILSELRRMNEVLAESLTR